MVDEGERLIEEYQRFHQHSCRWGGTADGFGIRQNPLTEMTRPLLIDRTAAVKVSR
jgi:hypothetical protein